MSETKFARVVPMLELVSWDHADGDGGLNRAVEDKATMGVRIVGRPGIFYLHMGTPAFQALRGGALTVAKCGKLDQNDTPCVLLEGHAPGHMDEHGNTWHWSKEPR